ncbi:MAG: hypothetical protein ACOY7J_17910, partial [Pseudomonadota bacterium]
ADHAEFVLTLETGLDALRQVFRVDGKLVPSVVETPPIPDGVAAPAPNEAPSGPVVIYYRWQG